MRKVTTISLDEKTSHIAKQMPNFSHFVRECLLRHHASQLNQDSCGWTKQDRFGGRCVPIVKDRPTCFVCWPHGRPSQDLVTLYLRDHQDLERLDRETKAENWQLLNIDQNFTVQEVEKDASKQGGKGNLWQKLRAIFRLTQ